MASSRPRNDNDEIGAFETPENKALEAKVHAWQEALATSSEKILYEVFPAKIRLLNDIHSQTHSKMHLFDVERRLRRAPDLDSEQCSSAMYALRVSLKQEIMELLKYIDTVKLWIELMIPKVEDGNNFGVQVQEEIVELLGSGRQAGMAVLTAGTKFFASRGKLASKVLKYPSLPDFHRSMLELDEKEFFTLRNCCLDLRNNYCILYDTMNKNIDRITKPKGSGDGRRSLY